MRDGIMKRQMLKLWFFVQEKVQLHRLKRDYGVRVMDSAETIKYIKKHRCSIARFGDGEFGIMLRQEGPPFQEGSSEMADALRGVFAGSSESLLLCIPHALMSTKGFEPWAKTFWEGWARSNQKAVVQEIRSLVGDSYYFGDAYVSRPYTAYKSNSFSTNMFSELKELWRSREILIVEGSKTRLGIGNDLFSDAKSIKRILAPAENAFCKYREIRDAVFANWHNELVIIALGPTATILASDLSNKGIQALDLGHVDIQYEWFLKGKKTFDPVPGKYTNETTSGRDVLDCSDKNYIEQIIAVIE